jgi:hypothetical protein
MSVGSLEEIIDDNHAIVSSSVAGPAIHCYCSPGQKRGELTLRLTTWRAASECVWVCLWLCGYTAVRLH